MKKEHFTLSPMQEYDIPSYPTRMENPKSTLKKLPTRWTKNVAVIACLGAMGIGALAGCIDQDRLHGGGAAAMPDYVASRTEQDALRPVDFHYGGAASEPFYVVYPTEQEITNCYVEHAGEFDIEVRTHTGGSGAGPFYVAYLTEQEALGIIRNRACEAGICFSSPIPDYEASFVVESEGSDVVFTATLSLYDETTRQGVVKNIVFPQDWHWFHPLSWELTNQDIESGLKQDFEERFGVSVVFMQNPGESIGDFDWDWEAEAIFTDEEKQEAGRSLSEQLIYQVDAFLEHLRIEGILPPNGGIS